MSLLENLPVDVHTPTQQEEKVVDILFGHKNDDKKCPGNHSTQSHEMLRTFEEGLLIVALFLIFSLPHVTDLVRKIPFVSSILWENLMKIIVILVVFMIIKKYY